MDHGNCIVTAPKHQCKDCPLEELCLAMAPNNDGLNNDGRPHRNNLVLAHHHLPPPSLVTLHLTIPSLRIFLDPERLSSM